MAKIRRMPVENQITTINVVKIAIKFSPYILKGILLPNTWASQQHKYLKHRDREPVRSKKNDAGASSSKFHGTNCRSENRPIRHVPTKKKPIANL